MKKRYYYRLKDSILGISHKWDTLSLSEENATSHATQYINPEPPRISNINPTLPSLEYCLASSNESINERFRCDRPEEIDLQIEKMLRNYQTTTNLVLYRGVCQHVYDLMIQNARKFNGVDFFEKGFMATSLVKGRELKREYQLRIFVPEGSNVIFMGNINYEKHFFEVDIHNNAKFRIVSIDSKYINCQLLN